MSKDDVRGYINRGGSSFPQNPYIIHHPSFIIHHYHTSAELKDMSPFSVSSTAAEVASALASQIKGKRGALGLAFILNSSNLPSDHHRH
jgi:hypothetical protein